MTFSTFQKIYCIFIFPWRRPTRTTFWTHLPEWCPPSCSVRFGKHWQTKKSEGERREGGEKSVWIDARCCCCCDSLDVRKQIPYRNGFEWIEFWRPVVGTSIDRLSFLLLLFRMPWAGVFFSIMAPVRWSHVWFLSPTDQSHWKTP